jgi:hypothetical protein
MASAYLSHGSLSTTRPEFRMGSRTGSVEFLRDVFFRPCRDSFRFLPLLPSDESLGYCLSPCGLGWSGGENFCGTFVFCTTYGSRQTSIRVGTAARGGGRLDSRGQGPCGSALTREVPIFLLRRGQVGRGPGDGQRGVWYSRTQFAADRQGRPSSRPKALAMPPRRGQLRQTNPIWRCGLGDRDQTCETKPISGGRDTP